LASLSSTQILKNKGKIKRISPTVAHKTNDQRRYKYLVSGRGNLYFVKQHSDSTKKFSETDIIKMREFLMVDFFGGRVF
jgi:hypothetical protein